MSDRSLVFPRARAFPHALIRLLPPRLALSSFWLLAARLAGQGLSVAFTALAARLLGQAGLGQYALVASVLLVANVFTTFGLDTLLVREVAQSGRRAPSLGAALWAQLGLSAICIPAIWLGAGLLSGKTPETILSLRLYSLSLLPLAFYTVFSAVLRARQRMDLFMLLSLVSGGLQAGGALFVLVSGGGLLSLAAALLAAQALAALAALALCAPWLPGLGFLRPAPIPALLRLLRQSWPLALLAALAVVYQRIGVVLLSLLATDSAAGSFAAAARLADAAKVVPYAYLGALFPALSRQALHLDGDRVTHRGSSLLLPAYGLAAALALSLFAGPLAGLLYGPGYAPAVPLLRVLAWALPPYAVSALLSLEMVTSGRERPVVLATAASLGASVILYALLIPAQGAAGAARAALAGECIQALLFVLVRYATRRKP